MFQPGFFPSVLMLRGFAQIQYRKLARKYAMQLSADEISSIIKKQIQNFDRAALVSETGTVLTSGDGIARVYGLEGALAGEPRRVRGWRHRAGAESRGGQRRRRRAR